MSDLISITGAHQTADGLLDASSNSAEALWTVERTAQYLCVCVRYLRDCGCPHLRLPGQGPKRQVLIRYEPPRVREWARLYASDKDL